MQRDKVLEKVIWEDYNPSDDSIYQTASTGPFAQSQMIFCYNCNKVIPSDSKFCPWCQIKLYTQCPKCGYNFSSQYPNCNQCGINIKEYLIGQVILALQRKKEKEEKERREMEIRRRQEEERQRQEAIRQRELEAQSRLEAERRRREKEEMERRRQEEKRRQEEIDAHIWQSWRENKRRIEEFKKSDEYKETLNYWISFLEYNSGKNQKMFVIAGLLCAIANVCMNIGPIVLAIIGFIVCIGGIVYALCCTSIFGSIDRMYESYAEENPCPEEAKLYIQKLMSSNGAWNLRIKKAPEQVLKAYGYVGGSAPSTGSKASQATGTTASSPAMYICKDCGYMTSFSYIRIIECPLCKSHNMDIYNGS